MKRIPLAASALLLAFAQLPAHAQQKAADFPSKPIRLVVPFAPGGPTDLAGRVVGQSVQQITGKPVVVENRPGAAGVVGADFVAKSPADGYTLLLCSAGAMAINPSLTPDISFVPLRDLTPVTHVVSIPYLLLVNPSSPMHSLGDLIARAKAMPGKLNAGSAGTGSTSHLANVLLNTMAKIDTVHVPYKGSALSDNDLMAGLLDLTFDAVPPALPLVRSGKLRALAVADSHRLSILPDVPTFAEAGLPGYEVSTWLGICAPAATPPEIVNKLNKLIVQGATTDASKKVFAEIGGEVIANSPDEFRKFIVAEQKKWGDVIRNAGITTTTK
ncbi:tripartite tricarboxylate transporter substrate binding protein [Pigmentiphaga soli]|uniref:Tripartite tricarboxylate transporter substrate binding protein n=1 Tax=Pigmentiphaga soli TaxID=1007095 RepID=A0ABP8GY02_9BURK